MSKFKRTFNFRTIDADKLAALPSEIDGKLDVSSPDEVAKHFEISKKASDGQPIGWKRKPVTVELEQPAWVEQLNELARTLIQNYISDFVKASYVDQFLEVGDHNWELIEKEAASSRGTSALNIPETVLELAASNFGQWVAADTNSEELGKRITGLVSGKVTQASITKHLGQCTQEVVEKLEARAMAWAEYIAESGDDHADELAEGYDFILAKLDKLKRKFTGDVGDLVANVL